MDHCTKSRRSRLTATCALFGCVWAWSVRADDAAEHAREPSGDQAFVVAGYLPWYRLDAVTPRRIGPVTDLIYFSVEPLPDGRLAIDALDAEAITRLRRFQHETGCRLLLCVGGGGRSGAFADLAADAGARARFAAALARLCESHGFDGVDFDWEHPEGERQLADYARLLREVRGRLGGGRLITVAQSPWRDFGRGVYRLVDRVHVMSYNHRHPQGRMADARRDVERMIRFGCPPDKLVLGIPFYGRNARGRTKTYGELAQFGRLDPDADMLLGYAFNGPSTVRRKTRYALQQSLGGVMIWELGQDAPDPQASLLRVIENELEIDRQERRF